MNLASCLAESPGRPVGNLGRLDPQCLPDPLQLDDLDALLAVSADWIVEPRVPAPCSGGSTKSVLPVQQNRSEEERKLAVTRETQKRFRDRKKVHLFKASACSQMWLSAELYLISFRPSRSTLKLTWPQQKPSWQFRSSGRNTYRPELLCLSEVQHSAKPTSMCMHT